RAVREAVLIVQKSLERFAARTRRAADREHPIAARSRIESTDELQSSFVEFFSQPRTQLRIVVAGDVGVHDDAIDANALQFIEQLVVLAIRPEIGEMRGDRRRESGNA